MGFFLVHTGVFDLILDFVVFYPTRKVFLVELFIEHYSNVSYLLLHPFLKDIFLHLDCILSMSMISLLPTSRTLMRNNFRVYVIGCSFLYSLQTSVTCLSALPLFSYHRLENCLNWVGEQGVAYFGVLMTLTFAFLFSTAYL